MCAFLNVFCRCDVTILIGGFRGGGPVGLSNFCSNSLFPCKETLI